MAPIDILNFLSAAAPVVASVASAVSGSGRSECEQQKVVHNTTNNITITYNNHFYINSPNDALNIVSQMQKQMPNLISGETRYKL